MYRPQWTSFNLPLSALEAAKQGVEIASPAVELGTLGLDQISFTLPVYQRGLVWTHLHGRKFQKSLAQGWPIGEIVLAEKAPESLPNNSGQKRRYDLIDGQQRTHWLNRTRDRFFADGLYSLETQNASMAVETIAQILALNGPTDVIEIYFAWTADSNFSRNTDLEDLNRFLHHLTANSSIKVPSHGSDNESSVHSAIVALNTEVKAQYAALQDLEIPTLVIRQSLNDSLHEIFQQLNSGTKLSDLDLLAAEWSTIQAPISSSKTLEASDREKVVQFAKNRISDTYDSEDYTYNPDLSELNDDDLSLFDMLYGLGRLAHDKYPSTFAALNESCDRLALFAAAIVFTGSVGSRKHLAVQYPDEPQSKIRDVSNFPNQFLQACRQIDSALSSVNSVKAGKRLKGRLGLIQASAYIAAFITNVYWVVPTSQTRMESRARVSNMEKTGPDSNPWSAARRIDAFKDGLVGWLLADILQEEFQGSDAYTNAAARVWSVFDRESGTFNANPLMLGHANGGELVSLLQNQFKQECDVAATPKQRRYSEAACAILRMAYSAAPPQINDEEIDHVIPFDLRKGRSFPVAINHPGNLMPLKKRINGKRGAVTLDIFLQENTVSDTDKNEATARVLIDVKSCEIGVLESRDRFRRFLESRYRALSSYALLASGIPDFDTKTKADNEVSTWDLE